LLKLKGKVYTSCVRRSLFMATRPRLDVMGV